MKTSLIDQGEHHGLNNIIFVMGVSNLVTAQFFYLCIQSAFSHFGTEGTGILFSAFFKDNLADLSLYDNVLDSHAVAEFCDWRQIKVIKSQIHTDGYKVKLCRIEPLQSMKRIEQRQRIFSSRHANSNLISIFD